ncbi:MAG TPA: dihydropteroate synthase [Azospirillaceae bacterium]|nr:dihydropteroate synthase [Azospirillaceae bacterium]
MASSASGSLKSFCPTPTPAARVYLRPVGLLPASVWAAGGAVPLAGGRFSFTTTELIVRDGGLIRRAVAPLPEVLAWGWERGREVAQRLDQLLGHLTRARPPFAGLGLERPAIMGIVNITPDSFSDGGEFLAPDQAVAHGRALMAEGADILDIGGESTRPGAEPVPADVEIVRVVPVIERLVSDGAVVSIDTRHAVVMKAAVAAGAAIVNDVSALTGDPDSLGVAAAGGAAVVLMHMLGEPGTMQDAPAYQDAALDVYDYLEVRVEACLAAGIPRERLAVDPGIGFGKTRDHNVEILRQLALYHGLGVPVLLGVSRKSVIGALSRGEPPRERLAGSLAAGVEGLGQGVQMVRVHDVAETFQARAVWNALHPPA